MIKNLSLNKNTKKKKTRKLPYLRFITFFILLISLLVLGGLIEKKVRSSKVLGLETKNEEEKKPLRVEIKEKTAKFANDIVKDAEKVVDNVMGEATKSIINTASSSADLVTDYVFKNTVGNLLKQIDKLPNRQKDEVRREICR